MSSAKSQTDVAVATMGARYVMVTVWSIIGSFLDPLDLSRCAKACRELRDVSINEQDGKIIATHLNIGNYGRKHLSPFLKPQYKYRALLSVCSPKIRVLQISLHRTIVDGNEISDQRTGAFPTLVATLSACRNLEEFYISGDGLFDNRQPGRLDVNMELFGDFLLSCERLHSLHIETGYIRLPDRSYEAFLQAISKIIAKNRLRILFLNFDDEVGGHPSRSDLVRAIVHADNLEDLGLIRHDCDFFADLSNQIKESCKNKGCSNVPSGLRHLCLHGWDYDVTNQYSFTELFCFFGNCHCLESIELRFPHEFWDNLDGCLQCLKALLWGKTQLQDLHLQFGCIEDMEVGDFIVDLATSKEWASFHVQELRFSAEANDKMIQHLKDAGIKYKFVEILEMGRDARWIDCSYLDFPRQEIGPLKEE